MAAGPADPDRFVSLGFEAIDWIEAYLCHGPGDVQGDPIVIDDEMATRAALCSETQAGGA